MKVQTVIGNYGYLGDFSSTESFYRNDYLTCVINNFFQAFYSYETLPFKIHLYLNMMLLQFLLL